ncbi:FxsB family radical SAM/SPASM domain protein [Actinoallomurus sp. NBC_01490]|uniref:FxsB family cyclophane-forming radical SAM/SPASM peptide maturase n=1 Tax=Actinoallomurus sp. NBC_01490 TaxID=2903557 RepID=UPI002E37ABB6|nr:FxsB family cyclophane-forming radical SAM/SPASM peptide maturase [Actinoallomurus sp. NBC_01490]
MIKGLNGRNRPIVKPTPFRQFILKVHSRCNLACTYCYLYTMADQRWRDRPPVMSDRIAGLAADRIAEHVRAHGLTDIAVVLHGGEPLLAGPDRLRHVVEAVRGAVGDSATVGFSLQSNGTLLDRGFLHLFDELGVRVGVSLDGDEAAHDRARRRARGGSHAQVTRGLAELTRPEFRHLFSGLLCVIDLGNDPIATYEALLAFSPPAIDLLLPHATWSNPPAGPAGAYASWLIPIFDRWFHAPVRETRIRLFEEIINVLLGGSSAVEGIGTSPAAMIVVETDGQIEQSDILAAAFDGAAYLGLDVVDDDFDAALRHPATVARQLGTTGIPGECRPCRWAAVCAGGHYPHRYQDQKGFDHRSVYCSDLFALFDHIRTALVDELAVRAGASRPPALHGSPLTVIP